jgi:chromosome segregation ATPase
LSEIVADAPTGESQEEVVTTTAPATPSEDDAATLKKRLAGKDQAYTRLKTDYEATASENATLREWKRQQELSTLTESERLKQEKADLESQLATARAEAQRATLQSKYPKAFETLGDDAPLNEAALAKLEKAIATAATETDDEPIVDPNSPRRTTARPTAKRTLEDAKKDLEAAGNPYFDDSAWGSTRG